MHYSDRSVWVDWLVGDQSTGAGRTKSAKAYTFFKEDYIHNIYTISYTFIQPMFNRSLKKNEEPHSVVIQFEQEEEKNGKEKDVSVVLSADCTCKTPL